jgi:hypothetical protein
MLKLAIYNTIKLKTNRLQKVIDLKKETGGQKHHFSS